MNTALFPAVALMSLGLFMGDANSASQVCRAQSGALQTPVIELYTSEGCSSCPPADRWLSTLKPAVAAQQAVVLAFHVGYWDYIGWVDRFAHPAHTQRQRQVAAANRQASVYTPQMVRDGRDWRDWHGGPARLDAKQGLGEATPARVSIEIRQSSADRFEASVSAVDSGPASVQRWAAYWTVTEHGHSSRVSAGENSGELLKHDFVVRQYNPAGDYKGAATLTLRTGAADPKHPRQINLVVYDPVTGRPLQALSLPCPAH
jgi:hypothetical protein